MVDVCDNCFIRMATVEGWFYSTARLNPYAAGTVSASVLQNRQLCDECCRKLIDAGLHPSTTANTNPLSGPHDA